MLSACTTQRAIQTTENSREISLAAHRNISNGFLLVPRAQAPSVTNTGAAKRTAMRTRKKTTSKNQKWKIKKFTKNKTTFRPASGFVERLFLGMNKDQVRDFLGSEKMRWILMPSQVFEYRLAKCDLKLHFYPDLLTGAYRVLRVEWKSVDTAKRAGDCFPEFAGFASSDSGE